MSEPAIVKVEVATEPEVVKVEIPGPQGPAGIAEVEWDSATESWPKRPNVEKPVWWTGPVEAEEPSDMSGTYKDKWVQY